MTYTQLQNYVLKLINQYSVAGTVVPSSYDNQQDYLNRIAGLANDAMTEIATTALPIPVILDLSTLTPEDLGKTYRYTMPSDFLRLQSGGTVVTTEEGYVLHTNVYAQQGRTYVLIPKREIEDGLSYTLTYYRYPTLLDADSPDGTQELDNLPESHYAVAFYVASFLVSDDNAYQNSLLYNKYEDKLAKMHSAISAEAHPTVDVYRMDAVGDGYYCI